MQYLHARVHNTCMHVYASASHIRMCARATSFEGTLWVENDLLCAQKRAYHTCTHVKISTSFGGVRCAFVSPKSFIICKKTTITRLDRNSFRYHDCLIQHTIHRTNVGHSDRSAIHAMALFQDHDLDGTVCVPYSQNSALH